jgi:hypothetical protein
MVDGREPHYYLARPGIEAVEYMRVLSRAEVEKMGGCDEGVDLQQVLNSLTRTIEGQRREIQRLTHRRI